MLKRPSASAYAHRRTTPKRGESVQVFLLKLSPKHIEKVESLDLLNFWPCQPYQSQRMVGVRSQLEPQLFQNLAANEVNERQSAGQNKEAQKAAAKQLSAEVCRAFPKDEAVKMHTKPNVSCCQMNDTKLNHANC